MCASPTGQHDQKVISPASPSSEVFFSDTSPLSSPYPTGASIFVFSPGRLKHSHSWSTISPKGLKPRSRGLSSVEESAEWADKEVERLPFSSPDHMNFYKRTRPAKGSRELSSPKKTEETFPKAKEQHHTPKKAESQTQAETQSRNRLSKKQTKTQSTNSRKSPQAGQQVASTLLHAEHQQDLMRRLKDSSSRESLDHEKTNGKGGNLEIRRYTQGREVEAGRERTRPGHDQKSFKRRAEGESQRHRISPHPVREPEKGAGKDSRQRENNEKATEHKNTSKETKHKRESQLTSKDIWRRKGSVVSPREAKEDTFSYSKEVSSKEGIVASINSIPETLHSPKGPLSPGPWKVPSSAKILSEAEVLRDPL